MAGADEILVKLKSIDVTTGCCHADFEGVYWKNVTEVTVQQSALQKFTNRFAGLRRHDDDYH